MLNLILNAGADVNIRDTRGNPALVSAIVNAQYAAAVQLVERGASVNVKGPKWAAIHVTAFCGQSDLCKILLEAGASVDQLGEASHTALMLACQEQHVETVTLLLEHGADPNRKKAKGRTPYGLTPTSFCGQTPTEAALEKFGGK